MIAITIGEGICKITCDDDLHIEQPDQVNGNFTKELKRLAAAVIQYAQYFRKEGKDLFADDLLGIHQRLIEISTTASKPDQDSLEKIIGDIYDGCGRSYWKCGISSCEVCPSTFDDGRRPYERYGTDHNCLHAEVLDIKARLHRIVERGECNANE